MTSYTNAQKGMPLPNARPQKTMKNQRDASKEKEFPAADVFAIAFIVGTIIVSILTQIR